MNYLLSVVFYIIGPQTPLKEKINEAEKSALPWDKDGAQ